MNAGKNADRNAGKNAGKNAGSFSLVVAVKLWYEQVWHLHYINVKQRYQTIGIMPKYLSAISNSIIGKYLFPFIMQKTALFII